MINVDETLNGADDISEILITEDELQERITALGQRIGEDYHGRTPLLVGVLKGVLLFMADLLRAIPIHVEVDFMAVASYSSEARDKGLVRLVKDLETPITNRDVLFIEDMVDTGLTLNYLLHTLRMRRPASLEVCTLFTKPGHRLINIPLKYTGFDLPNRFIVGYGLDYKEKYRNLPYIGLLKADVFQNENTNNNR
jgi:hypoxanthine phosphoribosyltransferase